VVRDQVSSVTENAQSTATEIERSAKEAGEANRSDALAAGQQVAAEIKRLEGEFTDLMRVLADEADGLRAKLDRARLLSGSAGQPGTGPLLEGEALADEVERPGIAAPSGADPVLPTTGSVAGAAQEEAAPDAQPDVEPRAVVADESGAPEGSSSKKPAAEGVGAHEEAPADDAAAEGAGACEAPLGEAADEEAPTDEDGGEPLLEEARVTPDDAGATEVERDAETAEQPVPEEFVEPAGKAADPDDVPADDASASTGSGSLEHDPQALVAAASDVELAELYTRALEREGKPDGDVDHWAAVSRAAVEEAARRPDFGENPSERAPGRKAKKRRAKVLQPLLQARAEAAGAEPGDTLADVGSAAPDPTPESGNKPEPESEPGPEGALLEGDDDERGDHEESRRWGPLRRLGRRGRPFIDFPGECAVCRQPFVAGNVEALAESGWFVVEGIGICPDDQERGWRLAEGTNLPYQPGSAK
jgi:hypothetical protein